MIFKQYAQILRGEKSETRRVGHTSVHPNQLLATVPKRGEPAYWFGAPHGLPVRVINPRRHVCASICETPDFVTSAYANRWLANANFVQARIHVLDVWQECLQDITHEGALREGVKSVAEYEVLWRSINIAKGVRWEDNPLVTVINFKRDSRLYHVLKEYPELLAGL